MFVHWLTALAPRLPALVLPALGRRREGRGTLAKLVGVVTRRLRSDRNVLQHAADVARDGMAIFDRDLCLVAWNRAYAEMFQFPAELIYVGVAIDALIRSLAERGVYGPLPVDEAVATRLEQLIEPRETARLDYAAFGRVLEMRSVRLDDGGIFFTYSDATAQAKSEEEHEAENLILERRVRERTEELELLNFELARAKAEAEDANISKSRFLAAASHDLLQPLNAARLYTTALREQLRPDGYATLHRLISNVDLSLEAVEENLGALLEISQLDAGAMQTEIIAFPLDELLRQLAIEFEPQARERGLRLTVVSCSLVVRSDRKLLRRMLQNLISNAVKYTRRGRVLVGARRRGPTVRIQIHDTGVGIPEGKRALIFREFERLPNAGQAVPGAGLGLSIVERLSGVLDHEVTLRSEVGRGSAFCVAVQRASGMLAPAAPLPPRTAVQRSLSGMSVAAIDNEADILAGMETLLKGWDCSVATGTGLPQVEAALARQSMTPDVIIADYHLGQAGSDPDGLAVVAALRAHHGWRPAVLITADRRPAIRTLAQLADVRVLNKPLRPAALRSLLSQWRLVSPISGPE